MKKERAALFPILEFLLAKWIDAAEFANVPVTDDVLRAQARVIQAKLIAIGCEEDYTGFFLSPGWLQKFKARSMIGRLKRHGEAGSTDTIVIQNAQEEIQAELLSYRLQDIWNCDESGLQYNKQPAYSNVKKVPGKVLAGVKLDKLRITTFHAVNADGSEKERLTVIGRAQHPHVFRRNKINPHNLPVTYRYNKKAWILSGLWYKYLRNLNDKMRIQGRQIILITDNCPSHPHPNSPPENSEGPIPPTLTHLKLLYLPPNSTSKLQPLDQGIIASFKAAYRRQYADYMVQYFNRYGISAPKLDILASIYMIADAWESIPSSTISNCWKKSGLLPQSPNLPQASEITSQGRNTSSTTDNFLTTTTAATQTTLRNLYPDSNTAEFHQIFEDFISDNDNLEGLADDTYESRIPDASLLVEEQVRLGLLTRGVYDMEVSYLDAAGDTDEDPDIDFLPPPTLLTHSEAIEHLYYLSRYLQSLPINTLPTPAGREITLSTMVEQTTYLAIAISLLVL